MSKILVLCHANRFRSPLVAAILRTYDLEVKSAGFLESGRPAGKQVRETAKMLHGGLDLESHHSTRVDAALMAWATDVVLMNPKHKFKIEQMFGPPRLGQRYVLLGSYAAPPVFSIPDLAFINPRSKEWFDTIGLIDRTSKWLAVEIKAR